MRSHLFGISRGLSSLVVLLLLAACGGGGGGGGGAPSAAPVVYDGNTSPAVITATNASIIAANVIGGTDSAQIIGGVSAESSDATQSQGTGPADLARRLSRNLRAIAAGAKLASDSQQLLTAVIPVNETMLCSGGGSVTRSGTLADNGTGTLSVSFNSCVEDGITVNGPASLRIDAAVMSFPYIYPTDTTLSFGRLTVRGTGLSIDAGGSIRIQANVGSPTETITLNLVEENKITGQKRQSVNFVIVDVSSPPSSTSTLTGQVFHSDHGYVNVTTISPFVFGTLAQLFPDSGQMLLTGALVAGSGNRTIRVTALNSTLVQLQLDTNGDGTVDNTARLKWIELTGPVGADLGDTDGDGMHNSWETSNPPMNPSSNDALLDNDGDGFSNVAEYEGGADPNNADSVPQAMRVMNLPANSDLIFDPATQKIYASVRGNPGAVVPIDPFTGSAGTAIQVGIDPVKLARSDNGQYLYVGLDGENAVQRIDLATQVANLTFSLGGDTISGLLYFVEDMEVLPGNPQSIAVSRKNKVWTSRHEGVAIYDDGIQRPTTAWGGNVIEFSGSAGTLYGYNNESTEFGFRRMAVDSSGVSVLDVTSNLVNEFNLDIKFHAGLIYTTTGHVINPVSRTVVGAFSVPGTSYKLVTADATIGRVFFVSLDASYSTWGVYAFDLSTRQLLGNVVIPGLTGTPGSLIRWGGKGLAFRTSSGQVHLITSSILIP